MAASNFDASLKRVLVHEGGFSDHPKDPGGATMKGVTQRVYDGYRDRQGRPRRPVREIAPAELKAIYRRQYWDAVRADELPGGVDYATFDAAVNSGPVQAAKWLQRAAGVVADGQIGEATLAALDGRAGEVVEAMCDLRLAMLRRLRTWPSFGAGWTRRVAEVREAARRMARAPAERSGRSRTAGGPPPPTAPGPDEIGKASPDALRLTRTPEGAGGVLAGTGGVGAAVAEQAERLAPFADFSLMLKWLFAALLLAGVALTLVGVWRRTAGAEAQA